jgi:hypothetical protein
MGPYPRALTVAVLILAPSAAALGQDGGPLDLRPLVQDLGEQARFLCEDIEGELGRWPEGRRLLRDAEAFAGAVDGLAATLRGRARPDQLLRQTGEVDETWDHLKDGFARRGSPPAIDRAVQRTDRVVAALHRALGSRPRPAESLDPAPPDDTGLPDPPSTVRRGERRTPSLRLKTISTVIGIVGSLIGVVGGIYKYGLQKLLAGIAILLVIGVCLVALAMLGGMDLRQFLGGLSPLGRGG